MSSWKLPLWGLVTFSALFLSCCASSVDPEGESAEARAPYSADLLDCSVRVLSSLPTFDPQLGTGVVVRSDEAGVFILTNAHVVLLESERTETQIIGVLPGYVGVEFSDGTQTMGELLTVVNEYSQDPTDTYLVDAALIKCPPRPGQIATVESLAPWHPVHEPIQVYSFTPLDHPNARRGYAIPDEWWAQTVILNTEIELGNSGSGVYRGGRLVGLLWARRDPDYRNGVVSPLYRIQEHLERAGFGWVLEDPRIPHSSRSQAESRDEVPASTGPGATPR